MNLILKVNIQMCDSSNSKRLNIYTIESISLKNCLIYGQKKIRIRETLQLFIDISSKVDVKKENILKLNDHCNRKGE